MDVQSHTLLRVTKTQFLSLKAEKSKECSHSMTGQRVNNPALIIGHCRTREAILPLLLPFVRPHMEYFVQSGMTQDKTDTDILEGVRRAPGRSVAHSWWHRRTGWDSRVHSLWRTEVNRHLLTEYLMGGYRMDGDRALPYEVQNQIRGIGWNKKFWIDSKKICFTMNVAKCSNRLPTVHCRISSPQRWSELIWAWHRATCHSQVIGYCVCGEKGQTKFLTGVPSKLT